MKHQLKIHPQYYEAVADGSKTFEYRNNDRGFQKGDIVELHEWDPTIEVDRSAHDLMPQDIVFGDYTGRALTFRIGYVLVVDKQYVVFSLLPLEQQ